MNGLESIADWPVERAAAGWVSASGISAAEGEADQEFALASVTKPLFALSILVAVEEGSLSLQQPIGPEGATVAHLLSHSSGLGPEANETPKGTDIQSTEPRKRVWQSSDLPTLAPVGAKRIYSNLGYELLGEALETQTGMTPSEYFHEAVASPLALSATKLTGSPAHGAHSTVNDLLAVVTELFHPTLVSPETVRRASSPFLENLAGVLPGYGNQDPNLWGLGFEIRGQKSPHWTGSNNSASTYGHFGRAGTFVWIDPENEIGCVGLSNRDFGPWAAQTWPVLSDAVLRAGGTPET